MLSCTVLQQRTQPVCFNTWPSCGVYCCVLLAVPPAAVAASLSTSSCGGLCLKMACVVMPPPVTSAVQHASTSCGQGRACTSLRHSACSWVAAAGQQVHPRTVSRAQHRSHMCATQLARPRLHLAAAQRLQVGSSSAATGQDCVKSTASTASPPMSTSLRHSAYTAARRQHIAGQHQQRRSPAKHTSAATQVALLLLLPTPCSAAAAAANHDATAASAPAALTAASSLGHAAGESPNPCSGSPCASPPGCTLCCATCPRSTAQLLLVQRHMPPPVQMRPSCHRTCSGSPCASLLMPSAVDAAVLTEAW
jgi:hypothetical protein